MSVYVKRYLAAERAYLSLYEILKYHVPAGCCLADFRCSKEYKKMLKQTFGKDKRWVNYKLENRDGKLQKIPYNEHKNKNASSTNIDDWYTYDEVKSKSDNIGIVFTPDKKLIGIDIDKCIVDGEIQHEHSDLIKSLIEQCNTYTEYSV